MPEYICVCCDFQTKIKTHYVRHLKTKKHQKKVENGLTQKSINLEPQIYPKIDDDFETNDEIICEYCEKSFSSLSHLSRHKKEL